MSSSSQVHRPSPLAGQIGTDAEQLADQLEQSSISAQPTTSTNTTSPHFTEQFPVASRHGLEADDEEDELSHREARQSLARVNSSSFEPFVQSRVGSPIPDNNGLGWPGT